MTDDNNHDGQPSTSQAGPVGPLPSLPTDIAKEKTPPIRIVSTAHMTSAPDPSETAYNPIPPLFLPTIPKSTENPNNERKRKSSPFEADAGDQVGDGAELPSKRRRLDEETSITVDDLNGWLAENGIPSDLLDDAVQMEDVLEALGMDGGEIATEEGAALEEGIPGAVATVDDIETVNDIMAMQIVNDMTDVIAISSVPTDPSHTASAVLTEAAHTSPATTFNAGIPAADTAGSSNPINGSTIQLQYPDVDATSLSMTDIPKEREAMVAWMYSQLQKHQKHVTMEEADMDEATRIAQARIRKDNRTRKQEWRARNVDRNKDNDLRGRVRRRADQKFGIDPSDEKERWIDQEFIKRKEKREFKSKVKTLDPEGNMMFSLNDGLNDISISQLIINIISGKDDAVDELIRRVTTSDVDLATLEDTLQEISEDEDLMKQFDELVAKSTVVKDTPQQQDSQIHEPSRQQDPQIQHRQMQTPQTFQQQIQPQNPHYQPTQTQQQRQKQLPHIGQAQRVANIPRRVPQTQTAPYQRTDTVDDALAAAFKAIVGPRNTPLQNIPHTATPVAPRSMGSHSRGNAAKRAANRPSPAESTTKAARKTQGVHSAAGRSRSNARDIDHGIVPDSAGADDIDINAIFPNGITEDQLQQLLASEGNLDSLSLEDIQALEAALGAATGEEDTAPPVNGNVDHMVLNAQALQSEGAGEVQAGLGDLDAELAGLDPEDRAALLQSLGISEDDLAATLAGNAVEELTPVHSVPATATQDTMTRDSQVRAPTVVTTRQLPSSTAETAAEAPLEDSRELMRQILSEAGVDMTKIDEPFIDMMHTLLNEGMEIDYVISVAIDSMNGVDTNADDDGIVPIDDMEDIPMLQFALPQDVVENTPAEEVNHTAIPPQEEEDLTMEGMDEGDGDYEDDLDVNLDDLGLTPELMELLKNPNLSQILEQARHGGNDDAAQKGISGRKTIQQGRSMSLNRQTQQAVRTQKSYYGTIPLHAPQPPAYHTGVIDINQLNVPPSVAAYTPSTAVNYGGMGYIPVPYVYPSTPNSYRQTPRSVADALAGVDLGALVKPLVWIPRSEKSGTDNGEEDGKVLRDMFSALRFKLTIPGFMSNSEGGGEDEGSRLDEVRRRVKAFGFPPVMAGVRL